MKKITLVMCLIFVWFFAYKSGSNSFPATVIGPFPNVNVCELIRTQMASRATVTACWYTSRAID